MDEVNRQEIERLRERVHDQGNTVQEHAGKLLQFEGGMTDLDRKLDAIHLSINGKIAELKADMKEDLLEIKTETKATNGRVAEHDRQISMLRGGLIVIAAGMPVLTGLLVWAVQSLVSQ